MFREIGRLRPTSVRVHFEEDDRNDSEGVEDYKTVREALGFARGWFGTNETMPTDEEMENCWLDISARDEKAGISVRLYLGHDDASMWYFTVNVDEAVFARYADSKLSQERNDSNRRLRALELITNAATSDIEAVSAIFNRLKARQQRRWRTA